MSIKQSKEEYARAIYDDIYSIYEMSTTSYFHFEQIIRRKYKFWHIVLAYKYHFIKHKCITCNDLTYFSCYCKRCPNGQWWSASSEIATQTILRDMFVAFMPATEYILK
jgi:hypothetical protein